MLKCAFGLVAVIAIAAATPAMASLHVYNFATPDDSEVTLASPASFTDNGLTVSVTGMKGAYPAGVVSDIHQNHNWIGVSAAPGFNRVAVGEWLSLDFTPAVGTLLNAIVFEQGTESGELEVYTGTEKIATISWAAAAGNSLISFSNFDQVAGSEFRFVATEGEFRLNQVTFAAVPEAGSIFIWSLGGMTILGMLWVRRSRQAA